MTRSQEQQDAEDLRRRREYEHAFRTWLAEIDARILTAPYLRFWAHLVQKP